MDLRHIQKKLTPLRRTFRPLTSSGLLQLLTGSPKSRYEHVSNQTLALNGPFSILQIDCNRHMRNWKFGVVSGGIARMELSQMRESQFIKIPLKVLLIR